MSIEDKILQDIANGYTVRELKNKIKNGGYRESVDRKIFPFVLVLVFIIFFLISVDMNYLLIRRIRQVESESLAQFKLLVKVRESSQKEKQRIDKLFQIAYNIAEEFPAVGRGMEEIFLDLKTENLENIDQRIDDLPVVMREMYIQEGIATHSLYLYEVLDSDYDFPMTLDGAFVPNKWGEVCWRPSWFTEDRIAYTRTRGSKTTRYTIHGGLDIVNPYDSRVFASNDGKVIDVGYNSMYGKYILIEHRLNGKPYSTTYYGHLSEIEVVKGQYVKKKQRIGVVGQTGVKCIGSHLHFEYKEWNGKRMVHKNFVLNSTHKKEWIKGYYWVKKVETTKEGEKKEYWKVILL